MVPRLSRLPSARASAFPRALALLVASGASAAALYACSSVTAQREVDDTNDASSSREGSVEGSPPPQPRPVDAAPGGDCDRYCALVSASCTGEFAQYTDTAQCMAVCETLPAGAAGDREGNSVACRQSYAGNVAKTDPALFCAAAGPFGGGVCGERCDAFCALAFAVCAVRPWPSPAACVSECSNVRFSDAGPDAGEGLNGPMSGDTLNCRTRRLLEALSVPEECNEIGPGGACTDAKTAPPVDNDD